MTEYKLSTSLTTRWCFLVLTISLVILSFNKISFAKTCPGNGSFDFIFPNRNFTQAPTNGKIIMPDKIIIDISGSTVTSADIIVADNPSFSPALFTEQGRLSGAQSKISVYVPKNTFSKDQSLYFRATPNCLIGDVNGDGRVTVLDALLVAKYASGGISLTAEQLARADLDSSGTVTIADALLIAQTAAGVIPVRDLIGTPVEVSADIVSETVVRFHDPDWNLSFGKILPPYNGVSPLISLGWYMREGYFLRPGAIYSAPYCSDPDLITTNDCGPLFTSIDNDNLSSLNQRTFDYATIPAIAYKYQAAFVDGFNTGNEIVVVGVTLDTDPWGSVPRPNHYMPFIVVFNQNGTMRSFLNLTKIDFASTPWRVGANPKFIIQYGPTEAIIGFMIDRGPYGGGGGFSFLYNIVLQKFNFITGQLVGEAVEFTTPAPVDEALHVKDAVIMPNGFLYLSGAYVHRVPGSPPDPVCGYYTDGVSTIFSINPSNLQLAWHTTLTGSACGYSSNIGSLSSVDNLLYFMRGNGELFEFEVNPTGTATQRKHTRLPGAPISVEVEPGIYLEDPIDLLALDDDLMVILGKAVAPGLGSTNEHYLLRLQRSTFRLKSPVNESQLLLRDLDSIPVGGGSSVYYEPNSRRILLTTSGILSSAYASSPSHASFYQLLINCNRNFQCESGQLTSHTLNFPLPDPSFNPVAEQTFPIEQRTFHWTTINSLILPERSMSFPFTLY